MSTQTRLPDMCIDEQSDDQQEDPLDRDGKRPIDPYGGVTDLLDEGSQAVVRYETGNVRDREMHWFRGEVVSSTPHGARIAVDGSDTVVGISRASHAGGGYFDVGLAGAEFFCVSQLSEQFLASEREQEESER